MNIHKGKGEDTFDVTEPSHLCILSNTKVMYAISYLLVQPE